MEELKEIPNFGIGKDFETIVTKLENDLKSIKDNKTIILAHVFSFRGSSKCS